MDFMVELLFDLGLRYGITQFGAEFILLLTRTNYFYHYSTLIHPTLLPQNS